MTMTTKQIEAFHVPSGARVVAMSPDIAVKIRARAERARCSPEGIVATAIRGYICAPRRPDRKPVMNAGERIDAAMKLKGRTRIPAFEWPVDGMAVAVRPLIVSILGMMAEENGNRGGWLGEFANAITLETLSDYERVVLKAQSEIDAYWAGDGPCTAAVLAMSLGVELKPPPTTTPPQFDRDRFSPFVEWTEHGRVVLPWEVRAAELRRKR